MKARLLRKILNNTGYTISNHEGYVAIGSIYCYNLISVNKKTLEVKYALGTFHEGRKYVEKNSNKELLFIWDKLHELIESGEIHDIINGKDHIENPIQVFTYDYDKVELIETKTDKIEFPNTDENGFLMYRNTHYPTREKAIESAVLDFSHSIELLSENIDDLEKKLAHKKDRLKKLTDFVEKYKPLIKEK